MFKYKFKYIDSTSNMPRVAQSLQCSCLNSQTPTGDVSYEGGFMRWKNFLKR